jgi:BON domain
VSYEQRGRRGYGSGYGAARIENYGRETYDRYGSPYRNRPFARGPKGYQRSDERLKEDISERLMESQHIDSSEVTVDVQGAKVILEGVVPSRHMKHAIEDLVDACPGVQDIENRVRVASPNYQGATASSPSQAGSSQSTPQAGSMQTQTGGSQSGTGSSSASSSTSPNDRSK